MRRPFGGAPEGQCDGVNVNPTVLWIIAAIIVIVGIVQLLQGQIIFGVVLIVVGCLVGPGGYSIFRSRSVSDRSRR